MGYTADKVLDVARAELGYCEKETNSNLDNKTANAGDGNFTKYSRDLYKAGYYQASKQGYAWCDCFHDWVHYLASGKNAALAQEVTCQTGPYGAGCGWSAQYYKDQGRIFSNPKVGDQIFFGASLASSEHTGIVEEVTETTVITIEGNTSDKVARRTYPINYNRIVGYGRPKYDDSNVDVLPSVIGTPSTGSPADEKKIWDYFMDKLDNAYGVAGLMGNLYAESALKSDNLQQTYEQKLHFTDTTYTSAVDDGAYSGFVKDCAGYGLAQWTYYTRKQALLNYAKHQNKSVGDFVMQLDFLHKELTESFKSVWADLKTADSVLSASNSVLLKYERPADQGESVRQKRAEFGQKYYDKYAEKKATTAPIVPTSPGVLKFTKGDIAKFTGDKHYISADSDNGKSVKDDRVKITDICVAGKHPYHCRSVDERGSFVGGVYGWVDANDLVSLDEHWIPKEGDVVIYNGDKHYVNANAANGAICKGGLAKITNIYQLGKSKHPYHLVRVSGKGATVWGWVDEGTFTKA